MTKYDLTRALWSLDPIEVTQLIGTIVDHLGMDVWGEETKDGIRKL